MDIDTDIFVINFDGSKKYIKYKQRNSKKIEDFKRYCSEFNLDYEI